MSKTIRVNIGDKIKFDFGGYTGDVCLQDFDRLLSMLRANGVDVKDTQMSKKPEFFNKAKKKQKVSITHG